MIYGFWQECWGNYFSVQFQIKFEDWVLRLPHNVSVSVVVGKLGIHFVMHI